MTRFLFILTFIYLFSNCKTSSPLVPSNESKTERMMRIMFYNTENLYDTFDDTLKNDNDFLPMGKRYWAKNKFEHKLNNIAKVIIALGEWQLPDLVGLTEIENQYVLNCLIQKTALSNSDYRIIHKESPDKRGIDVALLYRKSTFKPLIYNAITIKFPDDSTKTTRDILYVKGQAIDSDTIHIFVNHFPSRLGGMLETERNRKVVAQILRNAVDSIFKHESKPNIIITGDFNDNPDNTSLTDILRASTHLDTLIVNQLYNLSYPLFCQKIGSHKYRGEWNLIDQFIVSGNLLNSQNQLFVQKNDTHVFSADFLLTDDITYLGKKPFRTYDGYRYTGGFSDHLPVFLDIRKSKKN